MKYAVFMGVHGTAIVHVEANNPGEAMRLANDEFYEATIPICHQCSDTILDPSYGIAVDAEALP